jgi:hypothetical protein
MEEWERQRKDNTWWILGKQVMRKAGMWLGLTQNHVQWRAVLNIQVLLPELVDYWDVS